MDNLSIDLSHYRWGAGMGEDHASADMSPESLHAISKALQAGQLQGGALNNPNQSNSGALKVESLESALKVLTFDETHIRLWKKISKKPAFNTIEEYNEQSSYGALRGGFTREGELPEEEDATYTRRAQRIKYIGTVKSVTHQMQLVNINIGPIMQETTKAGILWVLQRADISLFWGDEGLVAEEWNGFYAQHRNNPAYSTLDDYDKSEVLIDLRGKTLREANLQTGEQVILRNFGHASLLCAPPKVLSDFATGFYAQKRYMSPPVAGANVVAGMNIPSFRGMFGEISFEYDIFGSKPGGIYSAAAAEHPKAPAAPTPDGATPVTVNATTGNTKFGDGAGTYFYAVAALNRYGRSTLVQLGGGLVTVTATGSVDLKFTATAGPYTASAFVIYRSKVNPTTTFATTQLFPLFTVPASGTYLGGSLATGYDGAAALSVRDLNRWLPGTEEAFLTQEDSSVIEFKQLAPLMRMPLARLSPADRFMVLLYGTPFLYAPKKFVRYINIGENFS